MVAYFNISRAAQKRTADGIRVLVKHKVYICVGKLGYSENRLMFSAITICSVYSVTAITASSCVGVLRAGVRRTLIEAPELLRVMMSVAEALLNELIICGGILVICSRPHIAAHNNSRVSLFPALLIKCILDCGVKVLGSERSVSRLAA